MGRAPTHKKTHSAMPRWAVEQSRFERTHKYPACRGAFPDCPEVIDPNNVADICRACPLYMNK